MEIELLPAVSLIPIVSVLIAPEEMLARVLNGNPHLQQFRILFISGIRSGILSQLDRSSMELSVRRAITSVRAVDHPGGEPPPLPDSGASAYERARDMAGHVAQAMKQASRG
jgi:hypothetical protein